MVLHVTQNLTFVLLFCVPFHVPVPALSFYSHLQVVQLIAQTASGEIPLVFDLRLMEAIMARLPNYSH